MPDWTPMYVLLGLIPIVFAAVAVYSTRRDRRVRETTDIEAINARHERFWFPWKNALAESGEEVVTSDTTPAAPHPPPPREQPSSPSYGNLGTTAGDDGDGGDALVGGGTMRPPPPFLRQSRDAAAATPGGRAGRGPWVRREDVDEGAFEDVSWS